MRKWAFTVGAALVLGGGCSMREGLSEFDCEETITNCRVVYSAFYGYQRACSTACAEQLVAPNRGRDDDDDGRRPRGERPAADAGEPASSAPRGEGGDQELGAAPVLDLTRYSAFDIPCERDSQCGPGKCLEGNCYYGCHSDAQCGSGDRCAVESGARLCLPDPNPPVECTRTAQCDSGFTCLNGACRQTCSSTEQCTNVLDRCGSGVCVPDRRPLGECVLNSECADGLVCLDGACVPACAEEADGGVCLAEPTPDLAPPPTSSEGEAPAVDDEPGDEEPEDSEVTPEVDDEQDEPGTEEPEPADAGASIPEIQ